jgi:hypothetical protein
MKKLAPRTRKLLLSIAALLIVAYIGLGTFIWHAMRQPPEVFGRVMSKMPAPVVFLLFPFETLWTHARAGALNVGDSAPDFLLTKVDKSGTVQLAELNKQQPVVLVFGSYT